MNEWNLHHFDRRQASPQSRSDTYHHPPFIPDCATNTGKVPQLAEAGIYTQTNNEYSIVYLRPFSCCSVHHILSYQSSAIQLGANVKVQRSRVTRINGQK
jgi:hypothetical protein